jgi:hypothetical protein
MTTWKKLTKREPEDWEKPPVIDSTIIACFMWVGELPKIGEEVLVYTKNSGYIIDMLIGVSAWGGLNFQNNQLEPVIYWTELPDKPVSEALPEMESVDIEEFVGLEEAVKSLKVITAGEYTKRLEQEKNNEA